MHEIGTSVFGFGSFRLDASERLLVGADGPIQLSPKVFDTLLMLVSNAGRVLSKEKMLAEIWDDSFVEENNLAQNISQLRRVLGETADLKFIETVPKFGYRFVADVTEESSASTEVIETTRARIYIDDGSSQTEIFQPIATEPVSYTHLIAGPRQVNTTLFAL